MPTPVSALIHAATMVNIFSYQKININIFYVFQNMLRQLYELSELKYKIYWIIDKLYKYYLWFNKFVKRMCQYLINEQVIFLKNTSEIGLEIIFMFNNFKKSNYNEIININKHFLEWFIGFTEGDGSFIVSKEKVYFDITQNIEDVQVLYYIQKELGFGKILLRKEEHRRVGVFYISSKEHFLKLVHIFNSNICSNYRNEQFKLWLTTFNNQYKENVVWIDRKVKPSLHTAWLTGFIDAEGHLGGRVKYCRTSKLRKAPHLSLTISQKEFYILYLIKNLFVNGEKCISFDKSWKGWRLHIASFKILLSVINYLKIFPLKTKKSVAFF